MRSISRCTILRYIAILAFLTGCRSTQQVEQISITEHTPINGDTAVTHEIKEESHEADVEVQKDAAEAMKHQDIVRSKFKVDDEIIGVDHDDVTTTKHVIVGIMAPMSGKNNIIGSSIIDGAYIGLTDLFNRHKVPVRLITIDTGANMEDIECNISKLDNSDFDIIVGYMSGEQEKFVSAYLEHHTNKPFIINLNVEIDNMKYERSCNMVTRQQQFEAVMQHVSQQSQQKSILFLILQESENEQDWIGNVDEHSNIEVRTLKYHDHNARQAADDIHKIVQKIHEIKTATQNTDANEPNIFIVFTENNWKFKKLMSQIDSITNMVKTHIILASMTDVHSKMEMAAAKRHKFGKIAVVMPNEPNYGQFIGSFFAEYHKKPLELSFLSYNAILNLKDAKFVDDKWHIKHDDVCRVTATLQ